MLSAPGRRVQIPVEGMLGWDEEARRMGRGLQQLFDAGAEWLRQKEEVDQVAEQAQLASRMQSVRDETALDMQDAEVRDWDYAWQQASAGRVAEVVDELPPERREAGRKLALLYNRQASLEVRRDHELSQIDQARQRWQQELDRAVARGDDAQAQQWLSLGERVFVPESEMERTKGAVMSRSCLSRWREALDRQPLETLAELGRAQADALPGREEDAHSLTELEAQTRRSARRGLTERWVQGVEQGHLPDAREAEVSFAAGLLTESQRDGVKPGGLADDVRSRSRWLRLVDECPDDEESRTGMALDLVTAPLPVAERASMLRRLRESGEVSVADRRALSRGLYRLFVEGGLGNPADEQACRRYLALQQEGMPVLRSGGAEASAAWLKQQRETGLCWVCYES